MPLAENLPLCSARFHVLIVCKLGMTLKTQCFFENSDVWLVTVGRLYWNLSADPLLVRSHVGPGLPRLKKKQAKSWIFRNQNQTFWFRKIQDFAWFFSIWATPDPILLAQRADIQNKMSNLCVFSKTKNLFFHVQSKLATAIASQRNLLRDMSNDRNPGFFGIKIKHFDSEKSRILLDFFLSGQPRTPHGSVPKPP